MPRSVPISTPGSIPSTVPSCVPSHVPSPISNLKPSAEKSHAYGSPNSDDDDITISDNEDEYIKFDISLV